MGFTKVVGIIDSDKKEIMPGLQKPFTKFKLFSISTDDVRFKNQDAKPEKETLLNSKNVLLALPSATPMTWVLQEICGELIDRKWQPFICAGDFLIVKEAAWLL